MKKPMIFLGSLLVLTLVAIFGREFVKGKVNPSIQPVRVTEPQSKKEIPPHVVYHMMFRYIVWLQSKSDELHAQGKNGSIYRTHFQTSAALTDQETQILNATALDTVDRVKEIDQQIEALVKADREKRKNEFAGKPLPTSPPPLNPEITKLDEQRKSIITAGYNRIRTSMNSGRFADFNEWVKSSLGSQIKPVSDGFKHTQRMPLNAPSTGLKGGIR